MTPLVDRYTSNKITRAHLRSERKECGELSGDADVHIGAKKAKQVLKNNNNK